VILVASQRLPRSHQNPAGLFSREVSRLAAAVI
jgi:hypothetical protein